MPHDYGIYAAWSTANLPHDKFVLERHKRRMADKIDILIARIAAKLAERRLSEREASLEATGKPDALRYIRTRRAMPGGDRLDAIAKTLNTTAQWLLGGDEEGVEPDQHDDGAAKLAAITQRRLPRALPVYGTALAADIEFSTSEGDLIAVEQIEVNFAEPSDRMACPTAIAGKDGYYVVTVWGHSMEPRYDSGRRQLVFAHRPARAGEDVVVQLRSPIDDGEMVTAVLIKQLVRIKAGFVVLRQFNPAAEFEVPQHKVKHIHPIIPWDDVLGF